jgi:hypothetical protein
MFNYHYFVKRTRIPYTTMGKLQCLRVPERDKRIPSLTQTYNPIGWNMFIAYPYKPSEEEEIFQLKMKFRAWESEVVIVDDEKEMS